MGIWKQNSIFKRETDKTNLNCESRHLFNYIFLFSISYGLSAFVGAAFFPAIYELDYTFINVVAGLALFWFLGFMLWPLYSIYNSFTFLIFCILLFLFLHIIFEYIIGCDRKGGDLPMNEAGLLKRLKRARAVFTVFVVITLVLFGLFLSSAKSGVETAFAEGRQEGIEEGRENGYSEGYEKGYDLGVSDGRASGNNDGSYHEGYLDGYDVGYDNGYDDGYSDGESNGVSSGGYTDSSSNEIGGQLVPITVYITDYGNKYHRWGCQYLWDSAIAISKPQAISSGYTACSVCNP